MKGIAFPLSSKVFLLISKKISRGQHYTENHTFYSQIMFCPSWDKIWEPRFLREKNSARKIGVSTEEKSYSRLAGSEHLCTVHCGPSKAALTFPDYTRILCFSIKIQLSLADAT